MLSESLVPVALRFEGDDTNVGLVCVCCMMQATICCNRQGWRARWSLRHCSPASRSVPTLVIWVEFIRVGETYVLYFGHDILSSDIH